MPRAKNETVGPHADALDAARQRYDEVERIATAARIALQAAILGAIAKGMTPAEAARRSGYTREHVSKMWSAAQRDAGGGTAPITRAMKRPPAKPDAD